VFQIRLGTLLLGVAGIAFGLAFGQGSAFGVAHAASNAWIALGLLQQSRDLWEARSQLTTCDPQVVWGWRYAVAWRIVIATTIGGYWLIDALETSGTIQFVSLPDDYSTAEFLSRQGLIFLALIIALSSAPWVRWSRPQARFAALLDVLGWTSGPCLACLALCQATLIPVLVHIAISGVESAQPYRFAGQLIYDVDVVGGRHRTHVLAFLSFAVIGLLLISVWLASWLARGKHSALRRWLMTILLLVTLAVSGSYALWVHKIGLHGVSPLLADAQVLRPWPCWLFAALLLSLFAAAGAFRLLYHEADESLQPIIVWHRGPGAYLNESRIMLIALSVSLIGMFNQFESPKEWLSLDAWIYLAGIALQSPDYCYLPFALFWLSICGYFTRRKIADIDRRMTPVALSPPDFILSWVVLGGIVIGLVEAATWLSFTWWLLSTSQRPITGRVLHNS
jgi:hypothetical protein